MPLNGTTRAAHTFTDFAVNNHSCSSVLDALPLVAVALLMSELGRDLPPTNYAFEAARNSTCG